VLVFAVRGSVQGVVHLIGVNLEAEHCLHVLAPVHHEIDEQMSPEVALLPQPGDRLFATSHLLVTACPEYNVTAVRMSRADVGRVPGPRVVRAAPSTRHLAG
jgi:hypothetical protein